MEEVWDSARPLGECWAARARPGDRAGPVVPWDNWSLVRSPLPSGIVPMQPELASEPFHRPGWVYEEKYDGWRMVISRTGVDHTGRFPQVDAVTVPVGHRNVTKPLCAMVINVKTAKGLDPTAGGDQ